MVVPTDLRVLDIDIEEVECPRPRIQWDEEERLKFFKTINDDGQIVAVICARYKGKLVIVDGAARYAALKAAGAKTIKVVVDSTLQDEFQIFGMMFKTESRSARSPYDMGLYIKEFKEQTGLNNRELSAKIGVSEHAIGRYLCIFDQPPDIAEAIREGALSLGHILKVNGIEDADRRVELLRTAVKGQLSTAKLGALAKPPKVKKSKTLRYSQRGVTVSILPGVSFAAMKAAIDEITTAYSAQLRDLQKNSLAMSDVLSAVGK